jgi:excisionase family DNA binding protein
MSTEEHWVDIADVAAHLAVNKESIYKWVATKGFPVHRAGRLFRFQLSEVDDWMKREGRFAPGAEDADSQRKT